jgi:hypothetical protein
MQTKQLTKTSNSLTAARLFAIGAIATGAAAFSAVPARAASFSAGQLNFTGLTSDFYTQLTSTAVGGNFTIDFNTPGNSASILSNNLTVASDANTASSLTPSSFQPISSPTGTFTKNTPTTFTLSNALSFAFGSGTTVNIASGNPFSLNFLSGGAVNFGFTNGNGIGTILNGADGTTAQVLSFTISDGSTDGGGNYGIVAGPVDPTAIPEPFTIIGTLVGGTAALRMRKKLTGSAKK